MPTRPQYHQSKFKPAPRPEFRGTAAQRGYDSAWRRFREWYLSCHPLCIFRNTPGHKQECGLAASVVDHIQPLTEGGPRLDESNCRSVCRRAHEVLTQNFKTTGRNTMPDDRQEAQEPKAEATQEVAGALPVGGCNPVDPDLRDRTARRAFTPAGFPGRGGYPVGSGQQNSVASVLHGLADAIARKQ